ILIWGWPALIVFRVIHVFLLHVTGPPLSEKRGRSMNLVLRLIFPIVISVVGILICQALIPFSNLWTPLSLQDKAAIVGIFMSIHMATNRLVGFLNKILEKAGSELRFGKGMASNTGKQPNDK